MDHPDKVFAFDTLFTTNHIQMLKILSCHLPPPLQGKLIVYIRFLELQYTMRLFTRNPFADIPLDRGQANTDLLNELSPFCTPSERGQLEQMKNLFQNMEQIQNMLQTLELLKDISPDLFGGSNPNDLSGMMDMIQELWKGSNG